MNYSTYFNYYSNKILKEAVVCLAITHMKFDFIAYFNYQVTSSDNFGKSLIYDFTNLIVLLSLVDIGWWFAGKLADFLTLVLILFDLRNGCYYRLRDRYLQNFWRFYKTRKAETLVEFSKITGRDKCVSEVEEMPVVHDNGSDESTNSTTNLTPNSLADSYFIIGQSSLFSESADVKQPSKFYTRFAKLMKAIFHKLV